MLTIVWIQKLCHRVVALGGARTHLETLCLLAELLLVECSLVVHLIQMLCRRERFWVGSGAGFGWILVVNHIGLRIVLLFCTHGINLGRT